MKRKKLFFAAMITTLILILSIGGATSAQSQEPQLKMVTIEAKNYGQVRKLAAMGIDIASVKKGEVKAGPRGLAMQSYLVEAVVSALDKKKLEKEAFSWSEVSGRGPAHKIGTPYTIYKSFDEPVTGIRAQLRRIHAAYPKLTQLKTIGHSIQKRPMLAMRITNEKGIRNKPQVLYLTTHHAREWVATQMGMRLINYLTENYGKDARVTDLLDSVEIWVIPVANPDGYQYTFTNERLWRKNLRDNDGDGAIGLLDGVDLNRNFDNHWGYDDEGSSPNWSDATYRGAAPNSEPETQAVVNFIEQNDFKFAISYHTSGNWILYPQGWQVKTASLDDPIFVAQAGTDAHPAIYDSLRNEGYDPGVGADLYIVNGDFTEWAYADAGVPAYVVELTDGYGFEFPDDEGMLQTVFEDNLDFALSLGESALDPAHPVVPKLANMPAQDVYHAPVTDSYGPDQIIEVLARKELDLSLDYSISGGDAQSAGFTEKLGETYNDETGLYFSRYVAVIAGQQTGDSVSYQINYDGSFLGPYEYQVTSATGNPILLVAAEDYSGANPPYADPTQPNYLEFYTDTLEAGGYEYDVWDVDAQGIPTYPQVLSHYETVIWYTADDYAARVPLNLATQETEVLNFRDFLNYADGKLFATGQDLSWLATVAGYYSDDFFQYYLGALIHLEEVGMDLGTGLPFDVAGEAGDSIFNGLAFGLHDGDGANNQCCADTFLPTGHFLPYFDTSLAARYGRPGAGPFTPHSGEWYVYSQQADAGYKRLGGTFDIPTGTPTLKFWMSYDIESDWDYAIVEISPAGSDEWTTLPDMNGHTTPSTGLSCTSGWVDQLHPFLAHYMDAACNPTGTTGEWNGFTGNSGGWQQIEIDLSAYAGQSVELYISYVTDWATQNLGVFVDDIELADYPPEGFETGNGLWTPSVAPGSSTINNWLRDQGEGFQQEGPVIRTSDTVYMGFGFEAIDDVQYRNDLMQRVMSYLGQ